jgi:hypothetical protein
MVTMSQAAGLSTDFSVCIKQTMDTLDTDVVKTGIAVLKIPRLTKDLEAYPH